MFNKIILVGRLTRDIELRYTTSGSAVGSSAIAATRKYTLNNEKREETCFIDITFFGKTAEIANQYLQKGSKLLIEGRLKLEQWQDNNGQTRSKHSVSVEAMEMLGSPQQQDNQGYGQNNRQQQSYGGYGNQNFHNASKEAYHNKEIDYDKYDRDETIPF